MGSEIDSVCCVCGREECHEGLCGSVFDVAHTALVGRCHHRGIGAERKRDFSVAVTGGECFVAVGFLFLAAVSELAVGEAYIDAAGRDVDLDYVSVTDESDVAAVGSFRRDVADREAGCAA